MLYSPSSSSTVIPIAADASQSRRLFNHCTSRNSHHCAMNPAGSLHSLLITEFSRSCSSICSKLSNCFRFHSLFISDHPDHPCPCCNHLQHPCCNHPCCNHAVTQICYRNCLGPCILTSCNSVPLHFQAAQRRSGFCPASQRIRKGDMDRVSFVIFL